MDIANVFFSFIGLVILFYVSMFVIRLFLGALYGIIVIVVGISIMAMLFGIISIVT